MQFMQLSKTVGISLGLLLKSSTPGNTIYMFSSVNVKKILCGFELNQAVKCFLDLASLIFPIKVHSGEHGQAVIAFTVF